MTGDSIAQDVVVSDSANGSILSGIRSLTFGRGYHAGISKFLNILIVTIKKAGVCKFQHNDKNGVSTLARSLLSQDQKTQWPINFSIVNEN